MKTRTRKSELENLLKTISELSGISTEKKEGEKMEYRCVNRHESDRLTRIYQQSAKVPEIGSKIGSENCWQKRVQTNIYF